MEEQMIPSSGNVYEDLGYKDARGMQIKAELVRRLHTLMQERNLTQQFVAEQTGIPQPRLSKILHGQFREISEYRLLECLARLGNSVEIRIAQNITLPSHVNLVFA